MSFEAPVAAVQPTASPTPETVGAEQAAAPVSEVAPSPLPAPATTRAPSPVVAATAAATPSGLPKVQPFNLPLPQLISVAEGAGLMWVNSDADKVASVQSMIAAEPRPIRVPRERPPVTNIDEGPLVLVETRRDLSQMALPFKTAER